MLSENIVCKTFIQNVKPTLEKYYMYAYLDTKRKSTLKEKFWKKYIPYNYQLSPLGNNVMGDFIFNCSKFN